MTTFAENPHRKQRKIKNYAIFNASLNKTLEQKFQHKRFSQRFASVNRAFIGMGILAQIASLTTAFTMLSFLFNNLHWILRILAAMALVFMIEVIKRESTEDLMKGIFQYQDVEYFPAILSAIAIASSIYISIQGAKLLPTLMVPDPAQQAPALLSSQGIQQDFDKRILSMQQERDHFRKNRLYQGRLARKDSKVVEEYNAKIEGLQELKAAALAQLDQENQSIKDQATQDFALLQQNTAEERQTLAEQLVRAAVIFELLFLLAVCFSWWYYTECLKEKKEMAENAEMPINKGSTAAVLQQYYSDSLTKKDMLGHPAPSIQKIGFVDYQNQAPKKQKKEDSKQKIKQKYTRICPQCGNGFIHKSHNHTYCKRSCLIAAREKKSNSLSN